MVKASVFIVPALLVLTYGVCEGLECYHCFTGSALQQRDSKLPPCNEANLTASNTWKCPSEKSKCIYEVVEIEYTNQRQVWRTCSNELYKPCDPRSTPPGVRMVDCTYCGTDRCNLHRKENEEEKNNTFNINVNVNLFIRQ